MADLTFWSIVGKEEMESILPMYNMSSVNI